VKRGKALNIAKKSSEIV